MGNNNNGALPIKIECTKCPLRTLKHFREFTPRELDFVQKFKIGEFTADSGAAIVKEKTASPHLYTVLEGWAFRYKTLEDGSRQILNFAIPGDFIGLQSSIFGEMDHSVDALTPITLCVFPRDKIWGLFKQHPGLAFDVTWLSTQEERILGATLTTVGQRSARGRIAYVLLHLLARCEPIGLASADRMQVPFNQQHLADLLGLSLVHTNKTLKRMETSGLLSWQKGTIKFLDKEALADAAQFDETEVVSRPFI
ncbi:MAG: Crp/Fnr family transcriptional regulator [Rhodomicrobium sp.]|nr:Crp/Fnr family transcriptional regulator [Rhodomicrobium sp.]